MGSIPTRASELDMDDYAMNSTIPGLEIVFKERRSLFALKHDQFISTTSATVREERP